MLRDLRQYLSILLKCTAGERRYISIGVFLGVIYQICTLATPFLTRFLIDDVIGGKDRHLLSVVLLFSLIILILLFISALASNYVLIKAFKKSGLKLKLDLFENLQGAPLEFFGRTPSGEISYRLLQDTQVIEDSWGQYLATIPFQLVLLTSGVFMCLWHLRLSIFIFLILALQILIIVKFRGPLLRYSHLAKGKEQEVTGYTVERFRKMQLIRSLSTERKEAKRFLQTLQELIKIIIRAFMLTKLSGAVVSVVNNLWAFGVLWYGGSQVIAGTMTLGTLMAFLLFANLLYQPISALTNLVLSFQDVRASLKRILEYMDVGPRVLESSTAIEYIPREGKIVFQNVSFGYDSRVVLKDLSFEIPPKIIFALVGKSGVGKTTLCRLLVRFFDTGQGTIYLDGIDIRNFSIASLRRSVLLMLQNDYVITGTIWENITYGLREVTKEDVYRASREAALDFIDVLPEGYQTKIGEGGMNLSAGEAQRIALARAFLISPRILILDEPTSFIDSETEAKIRDSLLKIRQKSTVVLIAHRLSTVRIAEKIGVMDDGRIVEVGAHDELVEKENGVYQRIYSSILSE